MKHEKVRHDVKRNSTVLTVCSRRQKCDTVLRMPAGRRLWREADMSIYRTPRKRALSGLDVMRHEKVWPDVKF